MRKAAAEFPEYEEILNVLRFWFVQNLLAGLRKNNNNNNNNK